MTKSFDNASDALRALLRAYAKTVLFGREQADRIQREDAGETPSFSRISAPRVVREMVEASRGHPSGLARVAMLGPGEEVAGRTSSAAALSVALGQSLGLRSRDLVDIGTAVLLRGALGGGVGAFSRILAAEPTTASGRLRARIALEMEDGGTNAHLFARMGHIANAYVQLYFAQPEGARDPLQALAQIAAENGDARLIDMLVNTLRAFPESTAIVLESGTPGVVARHAGERPRDRPFVLLADSREIDLVRDGRAIVATAAYAGLVGPRTTVDKVADLERRAARTRVIDRDRVEPRPSRPTAAVPTARVRTPAPPARPRDSRPPPPKPDSRPPPPMDPPMRASQDAPTRETHRRPSVAVAPTSPPEVPKRPTLPDRPPTSTSAGQSTARERSLAVRDPFPAQERRGRLLDALESEKTEEAEIKEATVLPPARPSEIARFLMTTAGPESSPPPVSKSGPWAAIPTPQIEPPPLPNKPRSAIPSRAFEPSTAELGVADLFPELFRSVRSQEAEARTETHRPLWPAGTRPPSGDGRGRDLFGYEVFGEPRRVGVTVEYEATDPYDGNRVFVRSLDSSQIDESKLSSKEWTDLFEREAVIASAMSHPGVPRLIDAGISGTIRYVVYERPDGEPLREIIARKGRDRRSIRRIIRGLADALFHLHGRGAVHCNVRAANVMVRESGEGMLSDLSLAAPIGAPLHPLLSLHTISQPPEVHQGGTYGAAADQFALGALLYELLTGVHPYQVPGGERLKSGSVLAPDPRELAKDADPLLSGIALRMLRPKPEERFESCDAVARHLSRAGAIARRVTS